MAWVEERLEQRISEVAAELVKELGDLVVVQLERTVGDLAGLQREVRDLRQSADDLRLLVRSDLRNSSSPVEVDLQNPLRSGRPN